MLRVMAGLVALSVSSSAFAQSAVRTPPVWKVAWRVVAAPDGAVMRVPVFSWAESEPPTAGQRYAAPPNIETVVRLDDRLREAQRARDIAELDRMLSAQYSETDANGVERNKQATLQLVSRGETPAPTLGMMTARSAGNAVVLTGEETDGSPARTHFTRVYVRDSGGDWKLLSSTTTMARY